MIVYSFKEEFKILLSLIAFAISVASCYDLINLLFKKSKILKIIVQLVYTCLFIIVTYHFAFKMHEGYIPQYSILILIISFVIYYCLIRNVFLKQIKHFKPLFNKIGILFNKLIQPLLIIKTTFSLYKIKKIKNNNQNTLQK